MSREDEVWRARIFSANAATSAAVCNGERRTPRCTRPPRDETTCRFDGDAHLGRRALAGGVEGVEVRSVVDDDGDGLPRALERRERLESFALAVG